MHLRQPGFTYSACSPFTKNKESIKQFKDTVDSRYIYQNDLGTACFHYDIAYGDFKDLNRRKLLTKYYVTKHLILLKTQNMMDTKVDLLHWLNFSIKKTFGGTVKRKLYLIKN